MKKNNVYFLIETSIFSILAIIFFILNFFSINVHTANIIYIIFILLSFGWFYFNAFFLQKHDIAVHAKMFKKNYIPTTTKQLPYKKNNIAGVLTLWLVMLLGILGVKLIGILTFQIFLCGICLLFILASIFSRKICLLSLLVLHNKNNCCRNCRINSWDFAIFSSTLIFAPKLSILATIINIALIVLGFFILVLWEIKFHKYPERFYPETNSNLSCRNCPKQCWNTKK